MSAEAPQRVERGGEYLRVADPAWRDPLDGSHAAKRGGRWNPPASFPVVYLCASVGVARANVLRKLAGHPYGPEDLDPATAPVLVGTRVAPAEFVDAVSDAGCAALGLPAAYPRDDGGEVGWDRCQPLGLRLWKAGEAGIACRSAAPGMAPGDEELAWFARGGRLAASRRVSFERWFWPPAA